jgi:hypothetical protein
MHFIWPTRPDAPKSSSNEHIFIQASTQTHAGLTSYLCLSGAFMKKPVTCNLVLALFISTLAIPVSFGQAQSSVKLIKSVDLAGYTPGADTAKYDASSNTLYVVTGGKDVDMKTANLEAVNPDTGDRKALLTFPDNHVEAMTFVEGDPRLFINLTQTNRLAVVDRNSMKVLNIWPVPPAQQNAMVAFDQAQHRLYVVCRQPGMVVVMNSDTGDVVGTQPAPLRSDEVQYDPNAHRLYVPGGEGYMGIYDTGDPDHLKLLEKVNTAPGAKTGILLPGMHRLFLAVSPGESKAMAKVLTYEVK